LSNCATALLRSQAKGFGSLNKGKIAAVIGFAFCLFTFALLLTYLDGQFSEASFRPFQVEGLSSVTMDRGAMEQAHRHLPPNPA
jgi:hypothetical protein